MLLPGVDTNTAIINAILAACEEEREACAEIARRHPVENRNKIDLRIDIAAAISNRGKDQT
jgi:hypothetical protein